MLSIQPAFRLILLVTSLLISCTFLSCRKCRECTATSWDGYEIAVKKQCVSVSDGFKALDDFEEDFRKLYSTYLVTCQD